MLSLLMVLALGLLGLSSIELRRSLRDDQAAVARANARLALVEAIGQLQKTLGPDQRVSATAEILGDQVGQPHWTGAWRTREEDGGPFFKRDDLDGGLRDVRQGAGWDPADEVMAWLVSGEAEPVAGAEGETVAMVGPGTTGDESAAAVEVPLVEVEDAAGRMNGHYAWWTGDLGVRANIGTTDPRSGTEASPDSPGDGGMFRVMASQAMDTGSMSGGVEFDDDEARRLASANTAALAAGGADWSRKHFFDFTVQSSGVLADVAEGGLKRDLTAYLASNGEVPPTSDAPGLSDDDLLVGGVTNDGELEGMSRHRLAGPRFGLLRDWARNATAFSVGKVASKLAELDPGDASSSRSLALANEQPVKLAGNRSVSLQPVLVEASNYTQMSCYRDRLSQYRGYDGAQRPLQYYQLRQLMYPRVVLWNPYNVELEMERRIVMIQGNGRQEMWTQNEDVNNLKPPKYFRPQSQWLNFEGGRSTSFGGWITQSEGYKDPYMGSYYFSVPATRFGPGECLVFSPAKSAEYNGLSTYRPGPYNLNANELSCEVAPDVSRAYYVSASDLGGGMDFKPTEFWYAPTPAWVVDGKSGVVNQSDDTRAIMKQVGSASTVTFESFDALPQVAVLSASLQFGAGKEPRIAWSSYERMPIQLLDRDNPQPTVVPNVRTREGIRLRWFHEHPSNKIGSGALAGTAHFEDALIANWNPRASFIVRSPWENIAGSLPSAGSGGGPWFFGAYTRDLYDQAVSWDEQAPVPRDGRYHGNPFGPPQEGADRHILFDVPRTETGLISLAQFQHAKLSELIWHPSYAVGNSLADPRLGGPYNIGLNRSAARAGTDASLGVGGFHENELGWSSDNQRSKTRSEWAVTARAILGNVPAADNLVYDLSFELNHGLWDRYFLSSGSAADKSRFLDDPWANPLPNGRMRLAPTTRGTASDDALDDFHRAAYQLVVDGAFNVNSTRVEAWKALLASTRRSGYGGAGAVPFPRVLDAPGGAWDSGGSAEGDSAWAGYRELNDPEINALAEAIVQQVQRRGPFISLADFVNRRLAEDETGRMGALQAAIEQAGLNQKHKTAYPLDNSKSLPDYGHPDNIRDATGLEQTLKPASKAWGAPSYLTQADVLQVIGPALTARSDTFVIRTYGDAVDAAGVVQARAWCEAVVQRTPEPLDPDESGLNPANPGTPEDFGRRFVITSFRWLQPGEV